MKYILLLALGLTSLSTFAKDQNLGLGVILGSPTGLSSNFKLSESRSIDSALSFDLSGDEFVHFHSTYLFRHPKALDLEGTFLGWYWGLGGRIQFDEDRDDKLTFGPRASIGSNYMLPKAPVELFVEAGLIMDVVPETEADLDAGVGVRYYF